MLDEDDLAAAVAGGVISAPQAAALRDLALKRQQARVAVGPEERFHFMRGFNDFFFAVGIVLFLSGIGYFTILVPAHSLGGAAIAWALAELLVARMRLVLPGILLVCFFAGFVMAASPVDFWFTSLDRTFDALTDWFVSERNEPPQRGFGDFFFAMGLYSLIGAAAATLFYLRFRLPFALLLIAAGLVGAVLMATEHFRPERAEWIDSLILLGCGVLVFATAMRFDMSDRERVTRLADCAFWLHLLASPLIVHSLITLVADNARNLSAMSAPVAVAIFAIFVLLTIIAIAIDRRALLVSGLTYLGVVIAYGITRATGTATTTRAPFVVFATLIVLGSMVLIIGVGWLPLRRRLLSILPAGLASRLPVIPALS